MNVWIAFGFAILWGASPDIDRDLRWAAIRINRLNKIVPLWPLSKFVMVFAAIIFAPYLLGLLGLDVGDGSLNPIENMRSAMATIAHH